MIAERYARGLIRAAKEKGELDKVFSDMEKFQEILSSEPTYFLLVSPSYTMKKKIEFIDSIARDLEFSDVSKNFLKLVIKKKREKLFKDIISYFFIFFYREKGVEKVTLLCAEEPEASWVEEVKDKLEKFLGKKVELRVEIKPELIAGFEIVGFDWRISASAKRYLDILSRE